ncbi:MAG: Uncharacterised protein [Hyphomonas sp. TMED17]|nr:MAG: Uncharacterised protein [Hyphomonas sp. TMED17]
MLGIDTRRPDSRGAMKINEHIGASHCNNGLSDIQKAVPELGRSQFITPGADQFQSKLVRQDTIGNKFERNTAKIVRQERVDITVNRMHISPDGRFLGFGKGNYVSIAQIRMT